MAVAFARDRMGRQGRVLAVSVMLAAIAGLGGCSDPSDFPKPGTAGPSSEAPGAKGSSRSEADQIDPSYVAKANDEAILYLAHGPDRRVPYAENLDVYHRNYGVLRSGRGDLIRSPEREMVRWAPSGSAVRVLEVFDQQAADLGNKADREAVAGDAGGDRPKSPGFGRRVTYAKVERIGPDAEALPPKDRSGFTPLEFVTRPLAAPEGSRR